MIRICGALFRRLKSFEGEVPFLLLPRLFRDQSEQVHITISHGRNMVRGRVEIENAALDQASKPPTAPKSRSCGRQRAGRVIQLSSRDQLMALFREQDLWCCWFKTAIFQLNEYLNLLWKSLVTLSSFVNAKLNQFVYFTSMSHGSVGIVKKKKKKKKTSSR